MVASVEVSLSALLIGTTVLESGVEVEEGEM